MSAITVQFQSTLPGWGATRGRIVTGAVVDISIHAPRMGSDSRKVSVSIILQTNFNPRSPDGERPCSPRPTARARHFNPRSPDGERHDRNDGHGHHHGEFQSTLPEWGATVHLGHAVGQGIGISIHAPRMGSDLDMNNGPTIFWLFQSTLPGWGATGHRPRAHRRMDISIHAPRMGSDDTAFRMPFHMSEFQSTLPGWGATLGPPMVRRPQRISIHAPRMGSDLRRSHSLLALIDFNPRSPDGERPAVTSSTFLRSHYFNPRSPDGERPGHATIPPTLCYFNPRSPDGERPQASATASSP